MKKTVLITLASIVCWNVQCQEYARILRSHTRYTLISSKDVEIEYNYTIQINSEKGREQGVLMSYSDRFQKITNAKIVVRDASGKKVKTLTKSHAIESEYNPSYQVSDTRRFILDPDFRNYPHTLEISYSLKLDGFLSLPVWMPCSDFNVAVESAVLEIQKPSGYAINVREENIENPPGNSSSSSTTTRTYVVNNLAHVDRNILYKDFFQMQPKVYVAPLSFQFGGVPGSMQSWQDFGDWFLALNSEPYTLQEGTRAFLDGLDKSDRAHVIKEIYQFMQQHTRYVSIQLGIGGFKSLSTETVEATGYGDCKALTTYMKNLLDYVGIRSNYVLVRAGGDVPAAIPDFPSNQFNHVFLGIPGEADTTYLECTSQVVPPEYLGTFTDDRNVLWVEKGHSAIIRSPAYTQNDNLESNRAQIALDANGNARILLETQSRGTFFDEFIMYQTAPPEAIRKSNLAKFRYPDFQIAKFTYNQPQPSVASFAAQFEIMVSGLGKAAGDKLIVPVNLLRPFTEYIAYSEQKGYCDILRAITVQDHVEVMLPETSSAIQIPGEANVLTPYGSYRLIIEGQSDRLLIKRKFIFHKGSYRFQDFKAFNSFFDKIKKIENTKIVLTSRT